MYVKIKKGIYHNLDTVSSFSFNRLKITLNLTFCNSEGDIVYEDIYFDNEKEYKKARKVLLKTINI